MATPIIPYQIVIKAISFLFIVLFVYAATSKLIIYEQFQIQLRESEFLSSHSELLAWLIPFIEYVIVGLFLFPKYVLTAFYGSFSIILLFTLYIIAALNFSESVPCSCGGIIAKLGWSEHIIFNLFFIALAFIGIVLIKRQGNFAY